MTIDEVIEGLGLRDCAVSNSQVNSSGRFVHLAQPWDVAMFHEDIVDILVGRATLAEVVSRNRGADLSDPWPDSNGPG